MISNSQFHLFIRNPSLQMNPQQNPYSFKKHTIPFSQFEASQRPTSKTLYFRRVKIIPFGHPRSLEVLHPLKSSNWSQAVLWWKPAHQRSFGEATSAETRRRKKRHLGRRFFLGARSSPVGPRTASVDSSPSPSWWVVRSVEPSLCNERNR